MAARAFISQGALSAWVSEDKVDLQGDTLTLRASGGSLTLLPASHFISVSGGEDAHKLVGRVKDEAALAALGAEAYMTSVILGDTAYETDPGFLATPLALEPGSEPALLAALRAASEG